MSLVSNNVIDAWFKRDSWVYKHFAYLFYNPIWKGNVPKGYSLCPYFWMAMFSMLVFRPFIIPVLFILRFSAKGFKPLGSSLKYMDDKIQNAGFLVHLSCVFPGAISAVVLFIGAACTLILFSFGIGFKSVILSYYLAGALPSLYLPIVLAVTFLTCLIYNEIKKYSSERCKVEYYTYIASPVCLAIGIYSMPSELYAVFVGVKDFAVYVTAGAVFLLKEAFAALLYPIKWIGEIISDIVNVGGAVGLYMVVVVCILGAIGYFATKFLDNEPSGSIKKPNTYSVEYTERQKSLLEYHETENRYLFDSLYLNSPGSYDFWRKHTAHLNVVGLFHSYYSGEISIECLKESIIKIGRAYHEGYFDRVNASESRRREMCMAVTDKIAKVLNATLFPIDWSLRQSRIWFAMMKEVISARKQGFCPYKKFND